MKTTYKNTVRRKAVRVALQHAEYFILCKKHLVSEEHTLMLLEKADKINDSK